MDIRGFVYALADIFPGPLKTAARWVADRLFAVWDDVSAVFRITVPRWRQWFDAATGFANNLVSMAAEVANTLKWLVLQFVPNFIKSKVDAALSWVSDRLSELHQFAQGIVNGALSWARDRINEVIDLAIRIRDYFLDRLRDVWNTLAVVARLVGDLLTDPAKFATWAAGAMFWALLRVADSLIEPIVDYLWARRQQVILKTLSRLESIIARLL